MARIRFAGRRARTVSSGGTNLQRFGACCRLSSGAVGLADDAHDSVAGADPGVVDALPRSLNLVIRERRRFPGLCSESRPPRCPSPMPRVGHGDDQSVVTGCRHPLPPPWLYPFSLMPATPLAARSLKADAVDASRPECLGVAGDKHHLVGFGHGECRHQAVVALARFMTGATRLQLGQHVPRSSRLAMPLALVTTMI